MRACQGRGEENAEETGSPWCPCGSSEGPAAHGEGLGRRGRAWAWRAGDSWGQDARPGNAQQAQHGELGPGAAHQTGELRLDARDKNAVPLPSEDMGDE